MFTFDYFMESQKICQKYFCMFTDGKIAELISARRALFGKDNYDHLFNESVNGQAQRELCMKDLVFAAFYESLNVPREVFMKSQDVYLQDKEKMNQY